MKKIMSLCIFLVSLLSAQSNIDENIITGSAGGKKIIDETPVVGYDPNANDETYRREAVYNFVLFYDAQKIKGMTPPKVQFVKMVNETVADTNTSNASADNRTITVAGYCLIEKDIHVATQPGSLMVQCETNIGGVTMFGDLKAENDPKIKALLVNPRWIDYRGGRYRVASADVTNEARTSYNIATYVNDRKLSEIGWSSLSVASEEGKTATNNYLKALEESRKKEEVAYVNVPNGSDNTSYTQAVELTNTEKPQASDYLIGAGVNILASTLKTTADIFKRDLPYLYEIVGGSKIYVDMQVFVKGEKIR